MSIVVLTSCEKDNISTNLPSCIETKIKEIKNKAIANPPTEVWRWDVKDEIYYYITSDCCDQFNILYDKHCQIICSPDGGFTGAGDGNCPEFEGEIRKVLVWEDIRD